MILLKKLIFIFIGCSLLITCNKKENIRTNLKEFEKKVDSSIFEKFPINSENIGDPDFFTVVSPSIIKRGYSGLFITYQFENETEYNQEIEKNSDNLEYRGYVQEENIQLIPDDLSSKNINFEQPLVPSLKDNLNFLNKILDETNSKFLILDAKHGEYYKDSYRLENTKYKSNGYSVGIYADDVNYLITYWLLLW